MSASAAKLKEALAWWNKLDAGERMMVQRWLRENPPPIAWLRDGWTGVDYAFTEMPGAPK